MEQIVKNIALGLKTRTRNAKLIKSLQRSEYDKLVSASDVGLILLRKEFTIPNFPSRLLTYLENNIPVLCVTDIVSDVGRKSEENNFGYWSLYGDIDQAIDITRKMKSSLSLSSQMGIYGFIFLLSEFNVKRVLN